MKFLPFPAALTAASIRTGRRLQASEFDDAGSRWQRGPVPSTYTAKSVAAYRTPTGMVSLAYDMYAPEHPEGSEPGLANVKYEAQHHPNDSSSYRPVILNFMSIPEIKNIVGLPVDMTAAAVLAYKDRVEITVAQSEPDLQDILETLNPDVKILRRTIKHVDFTPGAPMNFFLVTHSLGAGLEIHAATEEDALHQAIAQRYNFLEPADDLTSLLEGLENHARKHGWIMAYRDGRQIDLSHVPDDFTLRSSTLEAPGF